MSITFRGRNVSDVASGKLLINTIERGFLPSLKARLVKVTGKAGAYDFGSDKDILTFKITATLTASSMAELETNLEDVQSWLDGSDVGELVFDARPQVSYYAKLDGDTTRVPLGTSATLTFTLMCPDPTGVGITNTYSTLATDGTINVQNDGNEETQPVTTIVFAKDESEILLTNGYDSIVVGAPYNAYLDMQPQSEIVMTGNVTNPASMTTAQMVEDGYIDGDFTSNGYSMTQTAFSTWTSGATWHGAAKTQSLPAPVNDFLVTANVGFDNTGGKPGNLGRIVLYLIDENGQIFGEVGFMDLYGNADHPCPFARAGNAQSGTMLYQYKPKPLNYWQGGNNAYIEIGRRGKLWSCYFGLRNSKGQFFHADGKHIYPSNSAYFNQKLAAIEFHIGQFRSSVPYKTMFFGTTRVYQYNWGYGIADTPDANDTPFKKGDTLIIDNEAASVWLNGMPRADLVDPVSEFFSIPPGQSYVGVTPTANISSVSIDVTNKYK